MKNAYLAEMQKETWVMELRALNAFLRKMAQVERGPLKVESNTDASVEDVYSYQGDAGALLVAASAKKSPLSRMVVQDGTAIIPITGYLLKQVPAWMSFFGIDATSYSEIRDNLNTALANDSVKSILLKVDSPGGMVAGVQETADAIFAARKEKSVGAFIEDLGASGAYWLASQAETISANKNAEVGSIGVYTVYDDYSKYFEKAGVKTIVIASGVHKGMGVIGAPITDEQIEAVQEVIDGIADNFISSVARGRQDMSKSAVGALATGRVWLAAEAKEIGLVDRIESYESMLVSRRRDRSSLEKKGEVMAEDVRTTADTEVTNPAAPAPDIEAIRKNASAEAVESERKRLSDLRAAFPEDPEFAVKQFEAGASLDEAKVAYCDVLQKKNAELADKLQKAEAALPDGAVPVEHGEAPEGSAEQDFMSVSRALAEEKKISLTDAMRRTARDNPELFQAFKQKAGEQKVKV